MKMTRKPGMFLDVPGIFMFHLLPLLVQIIIKSIC